MNSFQEDSPNSIKIRSKHSVSKKQLVSKMISILMNPALTIKTMTILNYLQIKREQTKAQINHQRILMQLLVRAREVRR